MRHLLLLFLSILFAQNSIAQGHAYNSTCPEYAYCKDCGETKAAYKGNLIKYFEKEVDWAIMSRMSGVVVIKVLVDSVGNPCAQAFHNHTTVDVQTIRDMGLEKIVKRMGKWEPAMQNGQPVSAAIMLAIYSRVQNHKMFEVNYLRNDKDRKWIVSGTDGKKPITNYDDISDMAEQSK